MAAPRPTPTLIVATHNLMHGVRLEALLLHYVRLRDREGLDLLLVQEDRGEAGALPSRRIAAALGSSYQVVRADGCPGLAIVYDAHTLACDGWAAVPLPRLAALSWLERAYVVGGKTRPKFALVADLRPAVSGVPFAACSFHLDAAGGNAHRGLQVQALADALVGSGRHRRFVGGGDTNAFAWWRQDEVLTTLLAPLAAFGAGPCTGDGRPTHYCARQNEPKLTHRLCVALGKLGLDCPRRYDVVCTTLPVLARGQEVTPESDHDLVWARVEAGVTTTGSH
jgi:hypothetical protein